MKQLRVLCTIISALFLAAVLPIAAIWGWTFALCSIVGAGFFYLLMLLFKQKQEENPPFKEDEDNEEK